MSIAAGVQTTTDGEDARTSRIFLRPIGSPLPLGMAALAGASIKPAYGSSSEETSQE